MARPKAPRPDQAAAIREDTSQYWRTRPTPGGGRFRLESEFTPQGDQPRAIRELSEALAAGIRHQVLLGVTGSGKTFTMANVIANTNKPTLVLAPNKTLAAQLYGEFKSLFPHTRWNIS